MINIYKPYLPKQSLKYIYEAVDEGWISSLGKYKNLCEEKLKEKFGYKHVLLVNSGTAALHLISRCLKYKYPNINRIIVPNSVYCAAWNAFLFDKEFELFCETIDINTWNMNSFSSGINDAVLIVHNLGNIVNVPKLKRQYPDTIFIEDNCEGISGKYEGFYSGTQSLMSSLSFFANKNITSGEGGAFCTYDDDLYNYAKLLHGQAQSDKKYIHCDLGYNYRMTNLSAAILYGQLEIFDEIMDKKKNMFEYYRKELSTIENVKVQEIEEGTIHSNWMFGVRIIGNKNYEEVDRYFSKMGIETRPFFYPIHYHEHLKNIIRNHDSVPELLSKECFMIPSYKELELNDQKYIINTIKNYCKGQ